MQAYQPSLSMKLGVHCALINDMATNGVWIFSLHDRASKEKFAWIRNHESKIWVAVYYYYMKETITGM